MISLTPYPPTTTTTTEHCEKDILLLPPFHVEEVLFSFSPFFSGKAKVAQIKKRKEGKVAKEEVFCESDILLFPPFLPNIIRGKKTLI